MCLAGMLQPTSGECEIQGHSVLREAAAARRSLGICPQQNVFVGSLTVEEHLLLYASIKGIPGERTTSGIWLHQNSPELIFPLPPTMFEIPC